MHLRDDANTLTMIEAQPQECEALNWAGGPNAVVHCTVSKKYGSGRDCAELFAVAADEWLVLKSLTLSQSSQRIERDNLKHLHPRFEGPEQLVTQMNGN